MFKDASKVDAEDVEYVIKRVQSMTGKDTGQRERAFAEHLIRDAQTLAPTFMEIASNTALLKIAECVAVTVVGNGERVFNPDEVAFDLAGEFLAREVQTRDAGHQPRFSRRFRQLVVSKLKR